MTQPLAREFVCAWENTKEDATCGSSYRHDPGDDSVPCQKADGEHNTQLCVFSADGRLVSVMAGYQEVGELVEELRWVSETARPILENSSLTRDEQFARIRGEVSGRIPAMTERESRLAEIGYREPKAADRHFLSKHAGTPRESFEVSELVAGRGFPDHFFGLPAPDLPSGTLGRAPEARREGRILARLGALSPAELRELEDDPDVAKLLARIRKATEDPRRTARGDKDKLTTSKLGELKSLEAELAALLDRKVNLRPSRD